MSPVCWLLWQLHLDAICFVVYLLVWRWTAKSSGSDSLLLLEIWMAVFALLMISSSTELGIRRLKLMLTTTGSYWNCFRGVMRLVFVWTRISLHRHTSVTFLRHVLSSDGVSSDPEKVKAVREMPGPVDIIALQSFNGFVNYLAKFRAAPCDSEQTSTTSYCKWCWVPLGNRTGECFREYQATGIWFSNYKVLSAQQAACCPVRCEPVWTWSTVATGRSTTCFH